MPGFVKTPKDEKRWSKAKSAVSQSRKKDEASFADTDWALVNHIYHQMHKSEELENKLHKIAELAKSAEDTETLDILLEALEKAKKKKMSDEHDPFADDEDSDDLESQGFREFDPESEGDDADKWLEQNDPEYQPSEDEDEEGEEDEDVSDEDAEPAEEQPEEEVEPTEEEATEDADEAPQDEEVPAAAAKPQVPASSVPAMPSSGEAQTPVEEKPEGRFRQPTREEIAEMRQYTRPWEQRARDTIRLRAEAHKNPVLFQEGSIVEARNAAHKARQDAYNAMISSPDYQNADPITQMEMDDKFHSDWKAKNPDYFVNAVRSHAEAHDKGLKAKDIHSAAKDEQIRHVLRGGAQAESPMTMEEAMQHAGGTKSEEGTTGSTVQDKASSFAAGNREFLDQYAKEYQNKNKTPKNFDEMGSYDQGSARDIERILGEHPNLKDPAKKKKVDEFFAHYHPLIGMSASRVIKKLGLDPGKGDIDLGMLHEAGMHGLFQAINDYDHNNTGKANFATHAGNKIRGLMQTALRNQDQIPAEIRAKAKKFQQQKNVPAAPAAPKAHDLLAQSKHPAADQIKDRLRSIDTQRASQGVKKPEGENK